MEVACSQNCGLRNRRYSAVEYQPLPVIEAPPSQRFLPILVISPRLAVRSCRSQLHNVASVASRSACALCFVRWQNPARSSGMRVPQCGCGIGADRRLRWRSCQVDPLSGSGPQFTHIGQRHGMFSIARHHHLLAVEGRSLPTKETSWYLPACPAAWVRIAASLVGVLFGCCWHKNLSWPMSDKRYTYQVCVVCGMKRLFDKNSFRGYGSFSYDLNKISRGDERSLLPRVCDPESVEGTVPISD